MKGWLNNKPKTALNIIRGNHMIISTDAFDKNSTGFHDEIPEETRNRRNILNIIKDMHNKSIDIIPEGEKRKALSLRLGIIEVCPFSPILFNIL
jgi:hypothetical protein